VGARGRGRPGGARRPLAGPVCVRAGRAMPGEARLLRSEKNRDVSPPLPRVGGGGPHKWAAASAYEGQVVCEGGRVLSAGVRALDAPSCRLRRMDRRGRRRAASSRTGRSGHRSANRDVAETLPHRRSPSRRTARPWGRVRRARKRRCAAPPAAPNRRTETVSVAHGALLDAPTKFGITNDNHCLWQHQPVPPSRSPAAVRLRAPPFHESRHASLANSPNIQREIVCQRLPSPLLPRRLRTQ
jgi:hypothetical protein